MDPTTTWATQILDPLGQTLGFAHIGWFWPVAVIMSLIMVQIFVWSRTGSLGITVFSTIPVLVVSTFMLHLVPYWFFFTLVIPAGLYLILSLFRNEFSSSTKEDDVPNQLIQKSPEELSLQRAALRGHTYVSGSSEGIRISEEMKWPSGLPRTAVPVYISLEDKISGLLKTAKFDRGQKAFNSLKSEHDGVVLLFAGSKVNDTLLNVDRTKSAVEDVYTKGLSFIEHAVTVSKQTEVSDTNALQLETDELTEQLKNHPLDSTVGKTLKQVIDKNNNILGLVKKNKDSIDELLCQVSLCKDSIEEIRLTLPGLLTYTSADDLQKSIAEVDQRVSFAVKLKDEFKAQGL